MERSTAGLSPIYEDLRRENVGRSPCEASCTAWTFGRSSTSWRAAQARWTGPQRRRGRPHRGRGCAGGADRFVRALGEEAPPLAVAESVGWQPLAAIGDREFHIEESQEGDRRRTRLPGHRHLLGLPRRPAPPLPVHQLHQLLPALNLHEIRFLRPGHDHRVRLRDVLRVPERARRAFLQRLSCPAVHFYFCNVRSLLRLRFRVESWFGSSQVIVEDFCFLSQEVVYEALLPHEVGLDITVSEVHAQARVEQYPIDALVRPE